MIFTTAHPSRSYIHVDDVARAFVRSAERMQDQLEADETGVETYEIASKEDPSVMTVAERVKALVRAELGREIDIQLVDNPRSGETLVEDFAVDTTKARDRLGWEPEHTVDASVRERLRSRAETV